MRQTPDKREEAKMNTIVLLGAVLCPTLIVGVLLAVMMSGRRGRTD